MTTQQVSSEAQNATSVTTVQKTQTELIAEAKKYGIQTDGMETMQAVIFDNYVRKQLTQDISNKIADHLGCVFMEIETLINGGHIDEAFGLCASENIEHITLVVRKDAEGAPMFSIKRTLRNVTASNGERKQRASKYLITSQSGIQYESLSSMLHTLEPETSGKHINGAGVVNKLKKLVDLNHYNVINTDTQESEPFSVWAKLNIANCPTI